MCRYVGLSPFWIAWLVAMFRHPIQWWLLCMSLVLLHPYSWRSPSSMYKTLSSFKIVWISLIPIYLVWILQSARRSNRHVVNLYVKEIMVGICYCNHHALVSDHPLLWESTSEWVPWPVWAGRFGILVDSVLINFLSNSKSAIGTFTDSDLAGGLLLESCPVFHQITY